MSSRSPRSASRPRPARAAASACITVVWGALTGLALPLAVGAVGGCEPAMVATTLPLVTVGVAVVVNYAWQAERPDPNSELDFARVTFRPGLAVGLLAATAVAGALCWFILPA